MTPHFSVVGLWQDAQQAGLDAAGTVGRVSTPGRPIYIELIVPSQTHWHRQVLVRASRPLRSILYQLYRFNQCLLSLYDCFRFNLLNICILHRCGSVFRGTSQRTGAFVFM